MKDIAAGIDADVSQIDIGVATAFMCLRYHGVNNKWKWIRLSSQ